MKQYKYIVVFTNHTYETVYAFNLADAKILAQAEQIKKGNSHVIDHVKFYRNEDSEPVIYN